MSRSLVLAALVASGLTACGGVQIPQGNGYKNPRSEPWKKPKDIKLDTDNKGKADGDLSYPDFRRAKWYSVTLPARGDLALELDVTPPGDQDKFDLAVEIIDGKSFQVISKSDKDDDDAGELKKTKSLIDLPAGTYLIHLYLEGRLDTAEYELALAFTPGKPDAGGGGGDDDFPKGVAFPPPLPQVPLTDDTPATIVSHPCTGRHCGGGGGGGVRPPPPPPPPPPGGPAVSGRVINVGVSGANTVITINVGTADGLHDGAAGQVVGVKNGGFTTTGCTDHACKGSVGATVDQVNSSGKVVVKP